MLDTRPLRLPSLPVGSDKRMLEPVCRIQPAGLLLVCTTGIGRALVCTPWPTKCYSSMCQKDHAVVCLFI